VATATANCQGFSLSVNVSNLLSEVPYVISYSFTLNCSGTPTTITGTIPFTASGSTTVQTATGSFKGLAGKNCNVTGTVSIPGYATVPVTVNGTTATAGAALTCPAIVVTCPSTSGQVGVAYSSSIGVTGGVSPYTFSISSGSLPAGLTLTPGTGAITGKPTTPTSYSYTASVSDSAGDMASTGCGITIIPVPPPTCSTGLQSITSTIDEESCHAGQIIWFNSRIKLDGTIPTTDFTVQVLNGTITFGTTTLTVPNGLITFSSAATCASTTFDSTANQWETTLPLSAAGKADQIFATGLAYVLPANFSQTIKTATWTANFKASVPALELSWQWAAANYQASSGGNSFLWWSTPSYTFPMTGGAPDYNAMQIDPAHGVTTCSSCSQDDQAGTPENTTCKALLTSGGSGNGGTNYTGTCSTAPVISCHQ
jgi:hypothetical protein